MSDFKERVRQEANELEDKMVKLDSFVCGPKFKEIPQAEQMRLRCQLSAMRTYLEILCMRQQADFK